MNRLLTYAEVRELLRVSKKGVYRLVQAGRLPVYRLGPRSPRVSEVDVEAFVQSVKREPANSTNGTK